MFTFRSTAQQRSGHRCLVDEGVRAAEFGFIATKQRRQARRKVPEGTRSGSRQAKAVAVLVLFASAVGGCSDATGVDDGDCSAREDVLFTQLHDIAAELLPGVDYHISEVSGCESKGQVDPLLTAEIPTWSSEAFASRWMTRRGWVRQPAQKGDYAPEYSSPDGDFVATVFLRTGQQPRLIAISIITAAQVR